MTAPAPRIDESDEILRRKVAELEATLAKTKRSLAQVTAERDKLRCAYEQLKEHLELLRRRIFVAKAERINVAQLEIEFAETKAKLEKLATELGADSAPETSSTDSGAPDSNAKPPPRSKPKGRRDLSTIEMPEERLEILDPALEGTADRIGFEDSYRYGRRRGGPVRIVVARATYKTKDEQQVVSLVTAAKPKELFERGMLAPSLIAYILVSKYRFGLPFHRLATMLASEGVFLDDGTMCRYGEDAGATLGCIVDAMAKEAKATAFCLSTDATGVAIQPTPLPDGRRQPCRKGHFFVVLADQDHIFFEYQAKHTSDAVCSMLRGFSGYVQADAHCVYDALFRGEARVRPEDKPPGEVGCWSHARRRFWEAATAAKDRPALEALLRIRALFKLEEQWAKLAPAQRHRNRQLASRRIVDDFFTWAKVQFAVVADTRGLLRSAFGYAVRQEAALRRFLEDGRLRMENNRAERALRPIAVGRRSWFFFGSDDHAQAAANLFSLIASCQLHGLDPESYLAEIIRVLPHWARDRYIELAPKYWAATRARLDPDELERAVGFLTIPPNLAAE